MKKYYPSHFALNVIRFFLFIIYAAVVICTRIFLIDYKIISYIIYIVFSSSFIIVALIALPIYFSRTYYFVSVNEVAKQSGVIYVTKQVMRTESIQYLSYFSTPLSKFTGLNFLRFNALGGRVSLYFLSKKDADNITAIISAAIRQQSYEKK